MIFSFIKFLFLIILVSIIFGMLRTWQMEHSKNQSLFLSGTIPAPLPDGLYSGSVSGAKLSWLGKKFDAGNNAGINLFNSDGVKTEKYPFKTSVGKGTREEKDVFKLDYNISTNPFWLRLILDEIVEIVPNQYLGKLNLRIIPYYPFTLGYFELKK